MKYIKYLLLIILSIMLISGLTACGGEDKQPQTKKANKDYIQIKGSDTEVNLVQRFAETYMKDVDVNISVTGGGSGTGISALINGQVDIADASRTMKETEIKQAKNNDIEPVRAVIAMDGLSVITPTANPVKELTMKEIGKIFRGEITNWKQLGGQDLEISLYGRQSNSGTFVYFRDKVLKSDYSANMKRMNGNAQIVEAIKSDQAGIGYVGVGYVTDDEGNKVKGLSIINVAKTETAKAVSPLEPENVKSGDYPLARPLNQYFDGQPEGAILDFVKFELSEAGQEIAIEEGFYPVSPEFEKLNRKNLNL